MTGIEDGEDWYLAVFQNQKGEPELDVGLAIAGKLIPGLKLLRSKEKTIMQVTKAMGNVFRGRGET